MFPFIYLAMVVYLTVSVMYQLKHFVCLILIVLGRVSSTHQATRHRGKKTLNLTRARPFGRCAIKNLKSLKTTEVENPEEMQEAMRN